MIKPLIKDPNSEIHVDIEDLSSFLRQKGKIISVKKRKYSLQSHYVWDRIYRVSLKPLFGDINDTQRTFRH